MSGSRGAPPSRERGRGSAVTAPLLEMHGIVKTFPGVRALGGVDLDVRAGEVHCLLGSERRGKSTLIKVLAGAHQPDEGHITWRGEQVSLSDPQAAMRLGIATIYQELDLVAGLTVADNIFLGRESSRLGLTRPAVANRAAPRLLALLGHPEIRPTAEVGSLSASAQQMVSIARALSQDAKLIIMDEPSAVLDNEEVERLFAVIRDLTGHDVAVVYISHRLEEIRQIGDRITVLKDGRTVATGLPARDTATREVITLMTGRTIEYVFPPRRTAPADGAPLLEVEGLELRGHFDGVGFTVRPGEIVGLAGLVGSGRSEILETVYGARRPTAGTVRLAGRRLRPGDVGAAVAAGIGRAPGERKRRGLRASAWLRRKPRVRRCCWTTPSTATSPSPAWAGSPAADSSPAPPRRRPPGSRPRGWPSGRPMCPGSCGPSPVGTSRRSCSPAGCSASAACCCSTSPPGASTSAPARRSTRWSATSPTAGWPSSWSPARSRRSSGWPTASW